MRHSPWLGLLATALMTVLLSGCAFGDLFIRPSPTPVPTRAVAPTFTPTPDFMQGLFVVTPPSQGTPGVIIIPPGVDPRTLIPLPTTPAPTDTPEPPTAIPLPTATTTSVPPSVPPSVIEPEPPVATATVPSPTPEPPILIPTDTLIPTNTPTPTATPTPFVLVEAGLVNLRSGPGPDYPLVAQLGPNIPISTVGQNPEGTWYLVCCVNGESVWVAQAHIQTVNDAVGAPLTLSDAAPSPTPTATPTETATVTATPTATPYPFQPLLGPTYMPTNNPHLSIWVKVVGPDGVTPLTGYFLDVKFRNRAEGSAFESRQNTKGDDRSTEFFDFSAPAGPAGGNRVEFNYKYEFRPPDPRRSDPNTTLTPLSLIDGFWEAYLTDGSGRQLSDTLRFDTLAGNANREIFIAWRLAP